MGLVYALSDPRTGFVRYIGKTAGTLKKRMREHLCRARRGDRCGHVYTWLRAIGLKPGEDVMEDGIEGDEALADAERFWIASLKAAGAILVNHTDGGEGGTGYKHSPEMRQKLSEIQRGRKRGPRTDIRKLTPEQESEIVGRYKAGESCSEIKGGHGLSSEGVRKILLRNDVVLRPSWAKSPKMMETWRAKIVGPRGSSKLTPQQELEVVALYRSGITGPQIAQNFKVSNPTIYSVIKRAGVSTRREHV
jgi:GIY-YIG catalytic domain